MTLIILPFEPPKSGGTDHAENCKRLYGAHVEFIAEHDYPDGGKTWEVRLCEGYEDRWGVPVFELDPQYIALPPQQDLLALVGKKTTQPNRKGASDRHAG